MSSRAKNALLCVMRKLSILKNNSLKLVLKFVIPKYNLLHNMVTEVWGMGTNATIQCESVYLLGLKQILGVEMRTPNDLVYGETDRYPIYINSAIRCIRYWLKLLKMNSDRLPRKAYNMLYDLDKRGKTNWVSNVRICLCKNGLGYAWIYQSVGEENTFVRTLRQRLIDCRWQNWESHIQLSDRFDMYRHYSQTHLVKKYLCINIDSHLRFILTRFRLGISEIKTHALRYKHVDHAKLLCPMCNESEEDEIHFVLKCPVLTNLREKIIPKKYCANLCFDWLCW
eukprot:TRINITY_DN22952_c0_g1_i4.p1 TRINITY_DN22952_c0_g1~~TRINITY_DN22952_c0_g1_i4.p1  ORF type:complete len:307 (-),score=-7.22 TRINITY_DN22952_c0_g1_i4:6-854(-)